MDGGWDGKPEEGHGGDEKWSRSGNTFEWEPPGLLLDVTGGVRG